MNQDDPNNIVVDFSKYLKKIIELEEAKGTTVLPTNLTDQDSTAVRYVKRYDERAVNRIYINGGRRVR